MLYISELRLGKYYCLSMDFVMYEDGEIVSKDFTFDSAYDLAIIIYNSEFETYTKYNIYELIKLEGVVGVSTKKNILTLATYTKNAIFLSNILEYKGSFDKPLTDWIPSTMKSITVIDVENTIPRFQVTGIYNFGNIFDVIIQWLQTEAPCMHIVDDIIEFYTTLGYFHRYKIKDLLAFKSFLSKLSLGIV